MKKIYVLLFVTHLSTSKSAQNWSGSTPGNIYYNQGNVGVSASAPKAKLHLAGISTSTVGGDGLLLSDDSNPTRAFLFRLDDPSNDFQLDSRYNNIWTNVMTIKRNGGNVGIGLNPQGRFQVRGGTSNTSYLNGVAVYNNTGAAIRSSLSVTSDDDGRINLYNSSTSLKVLINSVGDSYFNGGNIGIYASSPKARLHVSGIATDQVGGDGIMLSDDTNPTRAFIFRLDNTSKNFHIDSRYNNTWTNALTILRNGGNVGIGIDNPDSKLVVDGRIRSEEVKVEIINGPDYVFESNYELRTLQETKEYISENKHLPEIPSAKEMEANGVDLGDMNMRLLKKIEELTLYIIEQNERLEKAEKKIEELEKN